MEKSATPSISIIPPASAAGEGVEQEPVAIVLFSSRCCLCDSSKSNFVTAAGRRPKILKRDQARQQSDIMTFIDNRYIAIGLLGGTELGTGCSCCSGHYCAETTGGEL